MGFMRSFVTVIDPAVPNGDSNTVSKAILIISFMPPSAQASTGKTDTKTAKTVNMTAVLSTHFLLNELTLVKSAAYKQMSGE